MSDFDAELFRKFWLDLSRKPGFSETDLLLKDGGRKYRPFFNAFNHNTACETAGGNCDKCPLPGQAKGRRCMTSGGSSLYARWHTATQIAKATGLPDFEERRSAIIDDAMLKFGFPKDSEIESHDDPRLFFGVDGFEAAALARGIAREIARLPFCGNVRRKMRKLDFLQMIWSFPAGREFSAADFTMFGESALVGWHLCALAQSGVIRRVGHGKYVHDGVEQPFVPLKRKILDAMRKTAIEKNDPAAEFTRNDFFTFAGIEAVSQQLSRLTKSGDILRSERGRYVLSEKNRPVILAKGAKPSFPASRLPRSCATSGFQEY